MKNQPSRRTCGFTLVELLVVIVIIAVLASAGFAAGNAAIQKARRTTALAAATAVESAVNNFYTEYGSMPADGDSDATTETKTNVTLLKILLGMDEGSTTPKNSRAVKFLSVREGKSNKNGLIYSSSGSDINGLFDPWGGPYQVMLDLDYDEKINVKPKGLGAVSRTLNGRRVAVWSDGADGATSTGKAADDVITW
jgi:prepilin-type N-terminal cleavage/methylation domain-containing protein